MVHSHLTFIMNHHSLHALSSECNFDFYPVQAVVCQNVFGFPCKHSKQAIRVASKVYSGISLYQYMKSFDRHLQITFEKFQADEEWHTTQLYDFNGLTMNAATFNSIFGNREGEAFSDQTIHDNIRELHAHFNVFWLGLPKFFFPHGSRALKTLTETQPSVEELLADEDLCDFLRDCLPDMQRCGFSKREIQGFNLVFMHINYNTVLVCYWTMYYLMEQEKARNHLLEEINRMIEERTDDSGTVRITMKELEKLPVLGKIGHNTGSSRFL